MTAKIGCVNERPAATPRNPLRNEADMFRVLIMFGVGAAIVIAVALLIGSLAGVIVLAVLVVDEQVFDADIDDNDALPNVFGPYEIWPADRCDLPLDAGDHDVLLRIRSALIGELRVLRIVEQLFALGRDEQHRAIAGARYVFDRRVE